jgi:hypothetical protein
MEQDHFEIDWTGVQPDQSPIAPLDADTFVERLRFLSERANSLLILRNALSQQQHHGDQLPRNSQPASRQPR